MKKPSGSYGYDFPNLGLTRLTLTHEALTLAMQAKSPIAGVCCVQRNDGKWDVFVKAAAYDTLQQMATPGENLSDTAVRLLSKPETPANG